MLPERRQQVLERSAADQVLAEVAEGGRRLVRVDRPQGELEPVMGFGVVLSIIGILTLCIRIYWANSYRRLDKVLQSPNRELSPKKEDVIQVLRTGLIISLSGLVLAFLASEVTVIAVLSKVLALPQGVAVYRPETVIRSLDLFVVLASVNLIGAHLVGSATSLGLLNWLDQ